MIHYIGLHINIFLLQSPNRSPYGGYSPFQHSASTPYAANLSSTSYTPNLSFQRSPNVSPYGINSSSFQQSPSMTSSPSQFSRHSSGFSNRFLSSPKSTYQRKNQRSDWVSCRTRLSLMALWFVLCKIYFFAFISLFLLLNFFTSRKTQKVVKVADRYKVPTIITIAIMDGI